MSKPWNDYKPTKMSIKVPTFTATRTTAATTKASQTTATMTTKTPTYTTITMTTTTKTTANTITPTTITTTKLFQDQSCIQFGGTRCVNKCKYFNFASSQTCTVFTPAKTVCSCSVFGTPTTTPIPLTPNPLISYCKNTASSCHQTCARFKYSATQVCRITSPKNVICICSWFL